MHIKYITVTQNRLKDANPFLASKQKQDLCLKIRLYYHKFATGIFIMCGKFSGSPNSSAASYSENALISHGPYLYTTFNRMCSGHVKFMQLVGWDRVHVFAE